MHTKHTFSLIFLLLLLPGVTAYATILPGIYNSASTHRLNRDQTELITDQLRMVTGLTELGFGPDGQMHPGNKIEGGSEDARQLLCQALASGKRFEIENHDGSPDIAFARISAGQDHVENGVRTTVFQIQLDLADFRSLTGDSAAIASFNIGLNILHELTHGALGLTDPVNGAPVEGDCEKVINKIRSNLNFPTRIRYDPDIAVSQLSSGGRVIIATLTFIDQTGTKRKISWSAARVAANASYAGGRSSSGAAAR